MTRFLFLFSDTGGGHRSGAQSVAQALQRLYGDDIEIALVDAFVEVQKWPFYHFPTWYPRMLKAKSIPWKVGYQITNHRVMVNSLASLAYPYVGASFGHLLHSYYPDAIVSFHSIFNRTLALTLDRLDLRIPTATVILDFLSAPAFWFAPGLDLYILPYEEMRERAARMGVASRQVEALGMPVRRQMLQGLQVSSAAAKDRLALPSSRPLVLLVGGGDGVGPLEPIAKCLMERRPEATLAVIAGHNQHLQHRLVSLAASYPLQVEGFVHNMETWLRAADILVTKAGPNSLAEAFVMKLPTVIYAAIPGQEEGNVALVTHHSAGLWAPSPKKAADAVLFLLHNPAERQMMAQRAWTLATPYAAEKIAQRLWQLGRSRRIYSALPGDHPALSVAVREIRAPAR